jgi:hypothetical protein
VPCRCWRPNLEGLSREGPKYPLSAPIVLGHSGAAGTEVALKQAQLVQAFVRRLGPPPKIANHIGMLVDVSRLALHHAVPDDRQRRLCTVRRREIGEQSASRPSSASAKASLWICHRPAGDRVRAGWASRLFTEEVVALETGDTGIEIHLERRCKFAPHGYRISWNVAWRSLQKLAEHKVLLPAQLDVGAPFNRFGSRWHSFVTTFAWTYIPVGDNSKK